jgi:MoxR-like ATPase
MSQAVTSLAPDQAAATVAEFGNRVLVNVEKVIVGKTPVIQAAISSFLADGHVLLEDAPGVAKTVLVKALAKSLDLGFKRIQCTPDLLPSDAIGTSIYHQGKGEFEFRPGPVFANIVLVDELNRATPRTQAALLECMAERQVTVDNTTHPMDRPFLVFATQNPFEHEGTFPLPEAQLDRFAIRLRVGYPSEADEVALLEMSRVRHPLETISSVVTTEQVIAAQEAVRFVHVAEPVRQYLTRLVRASRVHTDVLLGASPRASQALFHLAQASSAVAGLDFVTPDIIRYLAPMVLAHRMSLKPEARMRGRTANDVVNDILGGVAAPSLGRG